MFKQTLAALIPVTCLAASLTAALAVWQDHSPHVIAVPAASQIDKAMAREGAPMAVTGTATLEVSPDCADVTFTLATEALVPGPSIKQLEGKKLATIAALTQLGVASSDLKISSLRLDPLYDYPERSRPRLRGYQAQLTVVASTKDFSRIAGITEAVATAGAVGFKVDYRRSDIAELKKRVRAMALAAAQDKAKQIADTLGLKLGAVVSVAENAGGVMWRNTYFPSPNAQQTIDPSSPVIGGMLEPLTLDVTIGYELRGSEHAHAG
jgi:uncharacterized protein